MVGYVVENIGDVEVLVVFLVIKLDNLELVVVWEKLILVVCCVEMLVELMCFK